MRLRGPAWLLLSGRAATVRERGGDRSLTVAAREPGRRAATVRERGGDRSLTVAAREPAPGGVHESTGSCQVELGEAGGGSTFGSASPTRSSCQVSSRS